MNDYCQAVVNLCNDGTIPKDKPVLFVGISLGGMIAQQMIQFVPEGYTIKAVITFGSPVTKPFDRKDIKVVRFADKKDNVPVLGEMNYIFGDKRKAKQLNAQEVIYEQGLSDDAKWIDVHGLSYISAECWSKYDFLGEEPGTNTLVTLDTLTYYEAPIIHK